MHRVLQVIVASLTLIASSCITVGDSSLVVEGHLVPTDARVIKCNLELSLLEDGPLQPRAYYVRTINMDFSESFTIEPAVRRYRIAIACPSYEAIEKVIQSSRSLTRVEIGAVALVPQK